MQPPATDCGMAQMTKRDASNAASRKPGWSQEWKSQNNCSDTAIRLYKRMKITIAGYTWYATTTCTQTSKRPRNGLRLGPGCWTCEFHSTVALSKPSTGHDQALDTIKHWTRSSKRSSKDTNQVLHKKNTGKAYLYRPEQEFVRWKHMAKLFLIRQPGRVSTKAEI